MRKAKILYVEDDEGLSFVTRDNLQLRGYEVQHCSNGKEASERIRAEDFDLFILDVMLPEIDGFGLAEQIRSDNQEVPIIFLTAKSLEEDKLYGLKIGGDDYILKPFSIEELVLKVEIFLKRSRIVTPLTSTKAYRFGPFTFDYNNLLLSDPTQSRQLTQREAELLKFLLDHKNRIIKRSHILEAVWGADDYFLGRSLDVFISRLRKYFGEGSGVSIENIHGVGFRLNT
jgi:DNA-binding response OmpR family regulator